MNSIDELKIVLTLLGAENHRLSLTKFNSMKGYRARCEALRDRELVDMSMEIAQVALLPAGKAVLEMDLQSLPLDKSARKVLENLAKTAKPMKPSDLKMKAAEREAILQSLSDRGFVELTWQIQRTKAEIWLTPRGLEYLRDEFTPSGKSLLPLDLLGHYLRFLRQSLRGAEQENEALPSRSVTPPLDDLGILELIQTLDKNLGTENYLPIFYLREKLQPGLSRDEVDQALYRLQSQDLIELGSLQEVDAYTPDQIDAGIPQNVGGPLFFITVY